MAAGNAPAMSTPIQQLPPATVGAADLPTDPEVMAVLSEMEAEVQAARAAASAASAPPPSVGAAPRAPPSAAAPMPRGEPMALPPGCYFAPGGGLVCGAGMGGDGAGGAAALWNARYAQNAAIAAVIALALFYPASLDAFYQKIPVARLAALFSSHDKLARAALFAVVIYALLVKLGV